MQKLSPFQLVILGIFAFFIVLAVFVFAGLSGGGTNQDIGTVRVWGTFDPDVFDAFINELSDTDDRAQAIKYTYIDPEEYERELVDALAAGEGPDLFIIDQSHILPYWNKIAPIAYGEQYGIPTYTQRSFRDTFTDEAELFLSERGMLALPFTVDPMVLYWNRDLFADAGITKPPAFWDELADLSAQITKKQPNGVIDIATIALGTYDNITHAKDILLTMLLQKGGRMIERTPEGRLFSALAPTNKGAFGSVSPMQVVLRFYTEFANPVKFFYTWNRALPRDQDLFAQGRLALYLGYASELREIQAKNPNLNFDIAMMPQIRRDEARVLTAGRMYALAIPRQARNPYGATAIALFLTEPTPAALFAKWNATMPPLRGILNQPSNDPLREVFRRSAIIAQGELDPDPEKTSAIFRTMVQSVISGRLRFSEAVALADKELRALLELW